MESESDSRAGDYDDDDESRDPNYTPINQVRKRSQSPIDSQLSKKSKRPAQKSYKKKVERKWSEQDVTKLSTEIEPRRILWDMGSAEYKMPKESVWQEVADANSTSVNDCKGKWANLRTTFNVNLAKYRQKKSGQGTADSVAINWPYFKMMMFLEANKIQQSTQSTTSMPLVIISTFLLVSRSNYTHVFCDFQASSVDDNSIMFDFDSEDLLSSAPSSLMHATPGQRRRRKVTPSPSPSESSHKLQLKEMAVDALQSIQASSSQPKDKFTALGEYIAAELRSLTPSQAMFAKSKLNRAFNDIIDEAISTVNALSLFFDHSIIPSESLISLFLMFPN